jgi:hypothetical protein
MIERFVVKPRKNEYIVVHCADIDENGKLKKTAKPVVSRIENLTAAEEAADTLNRRYGFQNANSSNIS